MQPVTSAAPLADGAKTIFRRGSLTEWYVNDDRGVEQGFTLRERPSGHGTLVLEMKADTTQLLSLERGVLRIGEDLRYHGLAAWDIAGKPMPAHLERRGHTLRILVSDTGARYPMTIDPLIDAPYLETLTHPGSSGCCEFGHSVAIWGNTAVVGSPGDDVNGIDEAGSVQVFTRSGNEWIHGQTLVSPRLNEETGNLLFGWSVAVRDDMIVVGSPNEFFVLGPDNKYSGVAYLFRQVGDAWSSEGALIGDPHPEMTRDSFGEAVAISPIGIANIIVGAPGAALTAGRAFIFGPDRNTLARLSNPGGSERLGRSVDIAGGVAVVGAPGGFDRGRAQVYVESGGLWRHQAALMSPTMPDSTDLFGWDVAIDAKPQRTLPNVRAVPTHRIVVGAPQADGPVERPGAAHIFSSLNGLEWRHESVLEAPEPVPGDKFGLNVDIERDTVVVGTGHPLFEIHGFTREGVSWTHGRDYVLPPLRGNFCDEVTDIAVQGGNLIAGSAHFFEECLDAAHIFGRWFLVESEIYLSDYLGIDTPDPASLGIIDLPSGSILETEPVQAVPCDQSPPGIPCPLITADILNPIGPAPTPLTLLERGLAP